jgi:hypothetical protein
MATAAAATEEAEALAAEAAAALRALNDDCLAVFLKYPQPPFYLEDILQELTLGRRRFDLVQAAVADGTIDAHTVLTAGAGLAPLIHAAAGLGAMYFLRFLVLERGVDPNTAAGSGETPLHISI